MPLLKSPVRSALICLACLPFVVPTLSASDTWPAFRGRGTSHADALNLPLSWKDRDSAQGSWDVELPGYGQSSPVIWKDTVFVTSISGPEKEHLHLLAISLDSGKTLWQKDFDGTQKVKDSEYVSRGAPTPVVDDERVYAMFESGDVFALTHSGELVWQRSFVKDYGEIKGNHGLGSSPVMAGNNLIIQVTHSGPSYILALDPATGENRWKVDHPSQTGWSTPCVIDQNGEPGVVVSTPGAIRALNAASGAEWWIVKNSQGNTVASPTPFEGGLLIASGGEREGGGGRRPTPPGGGPAAGNANGGPSRQAAPPTGNPAATENAPNAEKPKQEQTSSEKQATEKQPEQKTAADKAPPAPTSRAGSLFIKLGGTGDVTDSHVVWNSPKVTTGFSSPVVIDGLAYFVNRVGVVQCVEAATGEVKWTHRLPGSAWASPVAYDGHVVIFCKEGAVVTLKAGPELSVVAESTVPAKETLYGVAAVDRSWIVRTGRSLSRVSAP